MHADPVQASFGRFWAFRSASAGALYVAILALSALGGLLVAFSTGPATAGLHLFLVVAGLALGWAVGVLGAIQGALALAFERDRGTLDGFVLSPFPRELLGSAVLRGSFARVARWGLPGVVAVFAHGAVGFPTLEFAWSAPALACLLGGVAYMGTAYGSAAAAEFASTPQALVEAVCRTVYPLALLTALLPIGVGILEAALHDRDADGRYPQIIFLWMTFLVVGCAWGARRRLTAAFRSRFDDRELL